MQQGAPLRQVSFAVPQPFIQDIKMMNIIPNILVPAVKGDDMEIITGSGITPESHP